MSIAMIQTRKQQCKRWLSFNKATILFGRTFHSHGTVTKASLQASIATLQMMKWEFKRWLSFYKEATSCGRTFHSQGTFVNSRTLTLMFVLRPLPRSPFSKIWESPWMHATAARQLAFSPQRRNLEANALEEMEDDDEAQGPKSNDETEELESQDEDELEDEDQEELEDEDDDDDEGEYEGEEEEEVVEGEQVGQEKKKETQPKPPKQKGEQGRVLNEAITSQTVRLVLDKKDHRILSREEALSYAKKRNLDLVQVDCRAKPPVCKVFDFHKEEYKQEQVRKDRKKKKGDTVRLSDIKEIRFASKIELKDLKMKVEKAKQFMERGHRVKFVAMYKADSAQGQLLDKVFPLVEDVAVIEQGPRVEKCQAWVMLRHVKFGPVKKKPPKVQPQIAEAEQIEAVNHEEHGHDVSESNAPNGTVHVSSQGKLRDAPQRGPVSQYNGPNGPAHVSFQGKLRDPPQRGPERSSFSPSRGPFGDPLARHSPSPGSQGPSPAPRDRAPSFSRSGPPRQATPLPVEMPPKVQPQMARDEQVEKHREESHESPPRYGAVQGSSQGQQRWTPAADRPRATLPLFKGIRDQSQSLFSSPSPGPSSLSDQPQSLFRDPPSPGTPRFPPGQGASQQGSLFPPQGPPKHVEEEKQGEDTHYTTHGPLQGPSQGQLRYMPPQGPQRSSFPPFNGYPDQSQDQVRYPQTPGPGFASAPPRVGTWFSPQSPPTQVAGGRQRDNWHGPSQTSGPPQGASQGQPRCTPPEGPQRSSFPLFQAPPDHTQDQFQHSSTPGPQRFSPAPPQGPAWFSSQGPPRYPPPGPVQTMPPKGWPHMAGAEHVEEEKHKDEGHGVPQSFGPQGPSQGQLRYKPLEGIPKPSLPPFQGSPDHSQGQFRYPPAPGPPRFSPPPPQGAPLFSPQGPPRQPPPAVFQAQTPVDQRPQSHHSHPGQGFMRYAAPLQGSHGHSPQGVPNYPRTQGPQGSSPRGPQGYVYQQGSAPLQFTPSRPQGYPPPSATNDFPPEDS